MAKPTVVPFELPLAEKTIFGLLSDARSFELHSDAL